MRIIRKKMEEKKKKTQVHATKAPKTPRGHPIKKDKLGIVRTKTVTSSNSNKDDKDFGPLSDLRDGIPRNLLEAVEMGNLEAVKKFIEAATNPAIQINW